MATLDNRKQRLFNYLKNPYIIIFLVILIAGIIIRLKFLFINSGMWWDEIGWLKAAQIIAGISPEIFEAAKAPLFALLGGFIFWIGLGENTIKILLIFLPSIGVVVLTYFLGRVIFNKKVGLIAMSIVAVLSHHLFYASRVMGDMMANFLELLAIVLFIYFYVKKQKPHLLFVPVAIGILGFLTRYSVSLALIAIALYLILTERLSLLKNKHFWIAALVATIMFITFFIINLQIFGNIWPALTHYILSPVSGVSAVSATHGFINSSFIFSIFDYLNFGGNLLGEGTVLIKSLVPFFLIGLACFFGMALGTDKILLLGKNKKPTEEIKKLKPIFALFLWLIVSAYGWVFIFHYTTPRWAMGIAPAIIVVTAYGYWLLYDLIVKIIDKTYIRRLSKIVATMIVLTLLIFSLTLMYQRTDRMIKVKSNGYGYLKQVSFWIQDNVPEEDLIMFPSYIWYQYYTQRNNFINEQVVKIAAFEHRNLTHLFFEEVQYGLIPVCEYDYEIAMRDTGVDWFVWSVGQQVWSPSPAYMNKLSSDGILVGYASFDASSWVFKINKEALNQKIDTLRYENQSYSVMTLEQWAPWNAYKQKVSITEKDICGYVYSEDVGEGSFYNDNQIERLHK